MIPELQSGETQLLKGSSLIYTAVWLDCIAPTAVRNLVHTLGGGTVRNALFLYIIF